MSLVSGYKSPAFSLFDGLAPMTYMCCIPDEAAAMRSHSDPVIPDERELALQSRARRDASWRRESEHQGRRATVRCACVLLHLLGPKSNSVTAEQICIGPPNQPCAVVCLHPAGEYTTGFQGTKASIAKKRRGVVQPVELGLPSRCAVARSP